MKSRGLFRAVSISLLTALTLSTTPVSAQAQQVQPVQVNLSHLNDLHSTVPYPTVPLQGHSTIDPGKPIDIWWVYANRQADGSYQPVGGGNYNPSTNTWGQGIADTDDVSRIAIVYLRHYEIYHDEFSLKMAYAALRFVIYMQINSGPHAGNFVNWIEPNGQPNLNPQPSEDTGNTFDWWAARSLWAMAEGYHVFKTENPGFAKVLQSRIQLAINSLRAQVNQKYGQYYDIHGYRLPKWLISDGADASSVAVIGLSRYFEDTGNPTAKEVLQKLAKGIRDSQVHSAPNQWPYNAHMPWEQSIDMWQAWGNQEIMALALAGKDLKESDLIASAKQEADSLYPHMILSDGPDNGWLPAPDNITQIAYGAESMTDSLLTLAQVTHDDLYAREAGIVATWFLGNNRAHTVMYHSDSGVTYDGINSDGTVNFNSGAESTLTALLAIMDVEANPDADHYFRYYKLVQGTHLVVINGDSGVTSGQASIVAAPQQWAGDFQWRTGKYAQLSKGGGVTYTVTVPSGGQYLIQLCYDKQQVPTKSLGVTVMVDGQRIGTVYQGGAGEQGDSPSPDYLWMQMLTKPVRLTQGVHVIRLEYVGKEGLSAKIDSLILQPLVEQETLQNANGDTIVVTHNMLNNQFSIR